MTMAYWLGTPTEKRRSGGSFASICRVCQERASAAGLACASDVQLRAASVGWGVSALLAIAPDVHEEALDEGRFRGPLV